jgi:hypothetical protein
MENTILSVCLGIGLAAACGFRIFVPFLIMNLAVRTGWLAVSGSFEWIGSTPALVVFAVATGLEIGGYYIPWLDHLLDSVATPTAVVAGVIASASVITGMDPLLKWTVAAIVGGAVAGTVQAATGLTRGVSLISTGGLANPLVSSAEAVGAVAMSTMAIFVPLAAAVLLVFAIAILLLRRRGRRARRAQRAVAPAP